MPELNLAAQNHKIALMIIVVYYYIDKMRNKSTQFLTLGPPPLLPLAVFHSTQGSASTHFFTPEFVTQCVCNHISRCTRRVWREQNITRSGKVSRKIPQQPKPIHLHFVRMFAGIRSQVVWAFDMEHFGCILCLKVQMFSILAFHTEPVQCQ